MHLGSLDLSCWVRLLGFFFFVLPLLCGIGLTSQDHVSIFYLIVYLGGTLVASALFLWDVVGFLVMVHEKKNREGEE